MYGERLRILRLRKRITQKEVADIIGVAPSTYTLYESEKREPDFNTLLDLANYFDVSCDYILGCSAFENSSQESQATENPDTAFDFLYEYCTEKEKQYIYCLFRELANAIAYWQKRGADGAMQLTEYFTAMIHCINKACTSDSKEQAESEQTLLLFLSSINHVVSEIAIRDFGNAPFTKKLSGDEDTKSLLNEAASINDRLYYAEYER